MSKIYFVSVNKYKAEEVRYCFKNSHVDLFVVDNIKIQEIMDIDLEIIIKDKILKAYRKLKSPCVVEHGALHIEALKGLPGGLSKVIWDTVGDDICKWIPKESRNARAKSMLGYCDGKKCYLFKGETRGTIADRKRGEREFQWDPIFIPEGETITYAELGFPEKMKYSQAAKAWEGLINHLGG